MTQSYEVVSFEQMAEEIVEATKAAKDRLEQTDAELKEQQSKTIDLVAAIEGIKKSASSIEEASEQLNATNKMLLQGEYGQVLAAFSDGQSLVRESIDEQQEQISSLSGEVAAQQQSLHELAMAQNEIKSRITPLEESLSRQESALDSLSTRLATIEESLTTIINALSPEGELQTKVDRIDKNAQKGFGKIKG